MNEPRYAHTARCRAADVQSVQRKSPAIGALAVMFATSVLNFLHINHRCPGCISGQDHADHMAFEKEMSQALKDLAPKQLVTAGTEGEALLLLRCCLNAADCTYSEKPQSEARLNSLYTLTAAQTTGFFLNPDLVKWNPGAGVRCEGESWTEISNASSIDVLASHICEFLFLTVVLSQLIWTLSCACHHNAYTLPQSFFI